MELELSAWWPSIKSVLPADLAEGPGEDLYLLLQLMGDN